MLLDLPLRFWEPTYEGNVFSAYKDMSFELLPEIGNVS